MTEPATGPAARHEALRGDDPSSSLERLWLSALNDLVHDGAHDAKNVLNGIALNVEVARTRSAKGAEAERIAPFAASAAEQVERLFPVVEGLLALTRQPHRPLDVVLTVRQQAAVAGVPAVEVPVPVGEHRTSVIAEAARIVLAGVVHGARVADPACAISVLPGPAIQIARPGGPPDLPSHVVRLAAAHGVRLEREGDTLVLHFPPATP